MTPALTSIRNCETGAIGGQVFTLISDARYQVWYLAAWLLRLVMQPPHINADLLSPKAPQSDLQAVI